MRKEQRNLQDAVAIQYAKMAMGETARGLFNTTRESATVEEIMQALIPDHDACSKKTVGASSRELGWTRLESGEVE